MMDTHTEREHRILIEAGVVTGYERMEKSASPLTMAKKMNLISDQTLTRLRARLFEQEEPLRFGGQINELSTLVPVASDLEPDEVSDWSRYRFLRQLGRGGTSTTYLVFDPVLGHEVTLKIMRGGSLTTRRRCNGEALTQASIDHPHICKVFETGEVFGHPYLAMQHIDGETLRARAASLRPSEVCRVIGQIARALEAVHGAGIIHRDVKPTNILVQNTRPPQACLIDFGLARPSVPFLSEVDGTLSGTPAFMSPEQARGDQRNLDHRTDIYSLGATFYFTLFGRLPFAVRALPQLIAQILEDEPSIPERLPSGLRTILLKCLAKSPRARYSRARDLARALDHWLGSRASSDLDKNAWRDA